MCVVAAMRPFLNRPNNDDIKGAINVQGHKNQINLIAFEQMQSYYSSRGSNLPTCKPFNTKTRKTLNTRNIYNF